MLESKPIPRRFPDPKAPAIPKQGRQQRLMASALILLMVALVSVLYHDRDFWFPEDRQIDDETPQGISAPAGTSAVQHKQTAAKNHTKAQPRPQSVADPTPPAPEAPAITRTALPPLEVEVIAGNTHRTLRPGSNTVQVDLERGSSPSRAKPTIAVDREPVAANVTSNAAERAVVSSNATELVTRSVTPGYPTLARQMRVQGSVILQAMISREGTIEDLHVVSGPPILAGAAEEAVKQWHFKPHYLGSEPTETQAKITVNFTISTN